MKNLMLVTFLMLAFNVNAFDQCVNYSSNIVIASTVETSESLSFKGCPGSVIIGDKMVKTLSRVLTSDAGKIDCVYGSYGMVIKCEL